MAWRSASAREAPRRTCSSASMARRKRSSSSSSDSRRRRWQRPLTAAPERLMKGIVGPPSSRPQHAGDRGGEALPALRLALELVGAGSRQAVELGAAVVLGDPPFGGDRALLFEPVERRVERALGHGKDVAGDLLDALRDAPAVLRLERQRAQDEEIEGALKHVGLAADHGFLPLDNRQQEFLLSLVECQGEYANRGRKVSGGAAPSRGRSGVGSWAGGSAGRWVSGGARRPRRGRRRRAQSAVRGSAR